VHQKKFKSVTRKKKLLPRKKIRIWHSEKKDEIATRKKKSFFLSFLKKVNLYNSF